MKRHIPNILTSLSILSGCIASVSAIEGNYFWAVIWVIFAAVCDFFDGFSARSLKVNSPIGKDLDSLADMVSFGVAPSMLIFRFLSDSYTLHVMESPIAKFIPYISFLIAIFSGLRLAKFNIDTRQTSSFIGLNTPANALFWISLCYGLSTNKIMIPGYISFYMVIALVFVFSFLLIAEIPMFSLKIKNYKLRGNELRYLLIVFMVVAVILWGLIGIAAGIIFYIILSILSSGLTKDKLQEK